jgi:hypothetical protein
MMSASCTADVVSVTGCCIQQPYRLVCDDVILSVLRSFGTLLMEHLSAMHTSANSAVLNVSKYQ